MTINNLSKFLIGNDEQYEPGVVLITGHWRSVCRLCFKPQSSLTLNLSSINPVTKSPYSSTHMHEKSSHIFSYMCWFITLVEEFLGRMPALHHLYPPLLNHNFRPSAPTSRTLGWDACLISSASTSCLSSMWMDIISAGPRYKRDTQPLI